MDPTPPDVILLGAEWRERALLRAQLIEEGVEVVAVDEWPIPRIYRRPGMKPRVLLINLRGLPNPRETLDEVRFVIPPDRVLVVTALGALTADEVRRLGFTAIERPATVGQVVAATVFLLADKSPNDQPPHYLTGSETLTGHATFTRLRLRFSPDTERRRVGHGE